MSQCCRSRFLISRLPPPPKPPRSHHHHYSSNHTSYSCHRRRTLIRPRPSTPPHLPRNFRPERPVNTVSSVGKQLRHRHAVQDVRSLGFRPRPLGHIRSRPLRIGRHRLSFFHRRRRRLLGNTRGRGRRHSVPVPIGRRELRSRNRWWRHLGRIFRCSRYCCERQQNWYPDSFRRL